MNAVHRAIIPAAGFGTRMLPAAKAMPKELLPILNRPTIQYVVEEAAEAGANDVLLIVSRDKRAIEDHFDRNAELEDRLNRSGRRELLATIDDLLKRVRLHSVRQREQRGLGDAVAQAEQHVGNDPFLCMLGDTIFSGDVGPAWQLAEAHAKLGTTVIGLEEVPPDRVARYGIIGGTFIGNGMLKIDALVEKPDAKSAPSRMAIAARYVLMPSIFDCLRQTKAGRGGEIQLTDALQILLKREPVHGVLLKSQRHDIGSVADWLKANLLFARRDAALWKELEPIIDQAKHGV
ncbi:MAG: UTP--glucose-1-phosphate uridylyltransferase [Phycisphaerae bacterium]|nr:UTP--glucose-1-phosphate uridylyltransferase [Phycisphaerae bacterium]